MKQATILDEIYQQSYDKERQRLYQILEKEYIQYVDEDHHSDAKRKFASDLWNEAYQKYHLGIEGFSFGLVRFEQFFSEEVLLFKKQPIERSFTKAKDKFIESWRNESRYVFIEEFFSHSINYIISELGTYKAYQEWGFNPFNLGKIKSQYFNIHSNDHREKDNKKDLEDDLKDEKNAKFKVLDDVHDELILRLRKLLLNADYISDISEENFKALFKGEETYLINWKFKLKLLIRFLDELYFMMLPTLFSYRKDVPSMQFKYAAKHFLFQNKELNQGSWNTYKGRINGINKEQDPDFTIIENIITELKQLKNKK